MNAEDLRMFALRRAAQTGQQQQLVIRVENNSQDCPMHSAAADEQRHLSRKEMARELRLLAARHEREAREMKANQAARRSSSFSPGPASPTSPEWPRSHSMDPYSHSYNSIPRNKPKVVPHQQARTQLSPPRDVFKGRVDFKSILRRFDPKDDERASGGRLVAPRQDLMPPGAGGGGGGGGPPRRGTIVDSDFDFRGSAPSLQYKSQPYQVNVIHQPTVRQIRPPQKLELSSREFLVNPAPAMPMSNPVSPKRVEFSEQVYFSFSGEELQRAAKTERSHVTAKTDTAAPKQLSLIEQFQQQEMERKHKLPPLVIEHANLDENVIDKDPNSNQRRKVSGESLVQIYVPEQTRQAEDPDDDDEDTISACSDKEDSGGGGGGGQHPPAGRTVSADTTRRPVPPMLSEWSRSQSFPPPGKSDTADTTSATDPSVAAAVTPGEGVDETGAFLERMPRKPSLPLTDSTMSINVINDGKTFKTSREENCK